MTAMAHADRISDQMQIRDVMYRYARAIDRCDWDRFLATFHPDADIHHGPYRGTADGFVAVLKKRHIGIVQSMHMISTIVVDFVDANTALAESYFSTFQRMTPEAGDYRLPFLRGQPVDDDHDVEVQVAGRYVDTFTRVAGVWRVAQRMVVYERYGGQPTPRGGGINPDWVVSRRNGQDPAEVKLKALGL